MDNNNIISFLYKKHFMKGDTSIDKEIYNEIYPVEPIIYPNNIWQEKSSIPITAPILPDHGISGVVQYFEKASSIVVNDAPLSFYCVDLKNAIPRDYGDGSYNYILYDSSDNQIFFSEYDWHADNESGIIRFYGGTPPNMPPKISFYKYVGLFGFPMNHSALLNLGVDDHLQYALLTGRSGGQTLIGGINASNNLTFQTTSNATKGKYIFPDLTLGNRILYNNASKELGVITTGSSLSWSAPTLNTIQDIRITAGPTFKHLYLNTYGNPSGYTLPTTGGAVITSEAVSLTDGKTGTLIFNGSPFGKDEGFVILFSNSDGGDDDGKICYTTDTDRWFFKRDAGKYENTAFGLHVGNDVMGTTFPDVAYIESPGYFVVNAPISYHFGTTDGGHDPATNFPRRLAFCNARYSGTGEPHIVQNATINRRFDISGYLDFCQYNTYIPDTEEKIQPYASLYGTCLLDPGIETDVCGKLSIEIGEDDSHLETILYMDFNGIDRAINSYKDIRMINNKGLSLYELTTNGLANITLKAPSSFTSSYTLTLPTTAGTSNYILKTNGSGTTSWMPFLDEDNMASDSPTSVASQQSIKAYVNNNVNPNTIIVSTSGSDVLGTGSEKAPYKTIKYAMSTITGNSIANPFTIFVYAGIYPEDNPIVCKEYVSIISIGGMLTTYIVALNGANNLLEVVNGTSLQGFSLLGPSFASSVDLSVAGQFAYQNVLIWNAQYGLHCNHASGLILGANIFSMTTTFTISRLLYCENGYIECSIIKTMALSAVTDLIYASGSTSIITAVNVISDSPNIINGVYANNGAKITLIGGNFASTTNALRIGSAGTGTQIFCHNVNIRDSITHDLYIESADGYFKGSNVAFNIDKLNYPSTARVYSFGLDDSIEQLRSYNDFSVGRDGAGARAYFGEGSSYEFNTIVKTWNGSAFTTVPYGTNILFPNTSVGTAIYFGDMNQHKFYGISILLNSTIILGGSGVIVWEYYDLISGWTSFATLNTLTGYSDSYTNASFKGRAGYYITIRFDNAIDDGVYESSSIATGWVATTIDSILGMWVRCRISTAITISPSFVNPRFKGNYTSFRTNGTHAYNGKARALSRESINAGEITGSASAYYLRVSTNINAGILQETTFTNGVDGMAYMRFPITENMDTSCGIKIKGSLHTYTAVASNTFMIMHFYVAILKKNTEYNYTAPQTEQTVKIAFLGGEGIGKNHQFECKSRICICDARVGDIVYVMLRRLTTETGDNLPNNIVVSNLWLEYYSWQNGELFADYSLLYYDTFETGSFVAGNWSVQNNATNAWICGSNGGMHGTYSAYISDDGLSNTYTNTVAGVSHLYTPMNFDSGLLNIRILFFWKGISDAETDYGSIWLIPAAVSPIADVELTPSASVFNIGQIAYNSASIAQKMVIDVDNAIVDIIAGSAYKLCFSFKSSGGGTGVNPAFTIDNVIVYIK